MQSTKNRKGLYLGLSAAALAGIGLWASGAKAAGGNADDDPDPPPNPTPGPPLPPPPPPDEIPADAIRPDSVGACVAGLPCGKGIFVRNLRTGQQSFTAPNGSNVTGMDALVYRLRYLGIAWVAVQAIFQESGNDFINGNSDAWNAYVGRLRQEGFQVWAWGWPDDEPSRSREFLRIAGAVSNTVGGFLVNAEAPWMRQPSRAIALMDEMNVLYPGRVGSILYGSRTPRSDHPTFPWTEFASRSFVLLPMIYETNRPDSYSRDLVRAWSSDFGKPIVPLFSATNARNAAGMTAVVRRTPVPAGACAWWDIYWLTDGGNSSRVEIVRRVNLNIGPGLLA